MARCSAFPSPPLAVAVADQARPCARLQRSEIALLVGVVAGAVGLGSPLGLHTLSATPPVLSLIAHNEVALLDAAAVYAGLVTLAGLVLVVALMIYGLCSAWQERTTKNLGHDQAVHPLAGAVSPDLQIPTTHTSLRGDQAAVLVTHGSGEQDLIHLGGVHMATLLGGESNR